jgi:hypothetical protein
VLAPAISGVMLPEASSNTIVSASFSFTRSARGKKWTRKNECQNRERGHPEQKKGDLLEARFSPPLAQRFI